MIRAFVALLILLLGVLPANAAVRTWLDRQDISMDETFTLNIEVDSVVAAQPDLRMLDSDFEVLGSSSSSEMSISNGARVSRILFAVALSPKRDGVITIPPITVEGESSEPIVLTVKPSSISGGPQGDVFLEAELSESNPYVQQQVLVTLRLFTGMRVEQGRLDLAIPDGIRALRLGDDKGYQSNRGGKQYSVIERRFALVPERSGSFVLGAAQFQGFGMGRGGLGGYFGSPTRLRAESEVLKLEVKAMPAGAASPWLPATSVQLRGEPEFPAEIRVGEPISYAVELSAEGLSVEQLPELQFAETEGLSIYPDQPSSRDRSSPEGLAGERSRRFALVPSLPGEWEIPALRLSWWDVAADQPREAELPARRITVLPARGLAGASAGPLGASQSAVDTAIDASPLRLAWPWMLLSALLALGWLWTWWRTRARLAGARGTSSPPLALEKPSALSSALRRALAEGDLGAIAQALRALAPKAQASTALADALNDPRQAAAVQQLDAALYGRSKSSLEELRAELRKAFAQGPSWRSSRRRHGADQVGLPPLYGSARASPADHGVDP
ncbi:BatD family protein [Pseudomarimonas arenosa]|uniref:Protein BatD n=1 Tax=Pseudomarimonas arenosa TaxID=2774145 RepID=A0AAW3ZG81_9GAMM|nr:BatD family protein [Pseudomarimonas arenosa]MBD8525031.1 protein BatD [Pseudomarimonas arenosa]